MSTPCLARTRWLRTTRRVTPWYAFTLLGPQSLFADNSLGIRQVCPPNGTAVLKGLKALSPHRFFSGRYLDNGKGATINILNKTEKVQQTVYQVLICSEGCRPDLSEEHPIR